MRRRLERKEIDWLREDYDVGQGRFSPDSRFLATSRTKPTSTGGEVYVRPFDASKPEAPGRVPPCRFRRTARSA